MSKRHLIFELLHTPEIETKTEYYVRLSIAAMIVLSIVAVMLETVEPIYVEYQDLFYYFELSTIIVFSIEYLLRVWSSVEDPRYSHPFFGRLRYMTSFMALVDLLSTLPFYIPMLIPFDLRFLRGLRLIRLFRVFKLGHYSKPLRNISIVIHEKRFDIFVSFCIILLLLIMSSSLMYFIENEAQPETFTSIPAALWWGVSTLTTIGYGDIVPITPLGRVCSAVISILGIGTFALPSGIIVSGLIETMNTEKESAKKLVYCPYCKEKLPH